jgi:oxygen-independent coproporphyrinogen-3 oxidase
MSEDRPQMRAPRLRIPDLKSEIPNPGSPTDRQESLGLYIHIPFCATRCGYCDFNTYAGLEGLIPAYVEALERELELRADQAHGAVSTLYFGGGTPSYVPYELLARVFSRTFSCFQVSPRAEITVEMNPDDACEEKLRAMRGMGANRLSIGCQSFDDGILRFLERRHTAEQAARSAALARKAGFENINLDLICAVPGQAMEAWQRTLETAAHLEPEHVSVYALTIEIGTPFWQRVKRGEIAPVEDDTGLAMIEMGQHLLETQGYERYEISNYAIPGKECRHNLGYWRGEEYVGVGAGAHSFVKGVRWRNVRRPADYVQMLKDDILPVEAAERLDAAGGLEEALMMGLRLREGVVTGEMFARFGRDPAKVYRKGIEELCESGHIECQNGRLRLNPRGWNVANAVLARLVAT